MLHRDNFVSVRLQSAQQPKKKSLSEAPKLNDHWSKTQPGLHPSRKFSQSPTENAKGVKDPPQIRRKTGNGNGLLSAFRPEIKKKWRREEYIFPNTTQSNIDTPEIDP
ncbi:hypothetical protein AVEN_18683-1 [Araneus ventricosus]|uniref:Uncharacterized protein n=1 Tax=Araneus ventricosus TaxID=182803 RepID=A0A4Y2ID16_ARAVE|nr:hypothetical protein AVEN_18683-1 [Araneus ventricosus]